MTDRMKKTKLNTLKRLQLTIAATAKVYAQVVVRPGGLYTSCLVRDAQLVRVCFESAVGLDHSLEVLLAPVSDWCTAATSCQSVNHTLCPDLVGFQLGTAITCIAGIALCLGDGHAGGNESCNLEHHCEGRVAKGVTC